MSRQFTNEELRLMDVTPEVLRQQVPKPVAEKIDDVVDKIKFKIPATYRDPGFLAKLKEFVREALLTEEATDALVNYAASYAPWGTGWLVRRFLDPLLPEKAIFAIFFFLDKLAD